MNPSSPMAILTVALFSSLATSCVTFDDNIHGLPSEHGPGDLGDGDRENNPNDADPADLDPADNSGGDSDLEDSIENNEGDGALGVTSLALGPTHGCYIAGNDLMCFGQDGPWLGAGEGVHEYFKPVLVDAAAANVYAWASVAVSNRRTCALGYIQEIFGLRLFCWGETQADDGIFLGIPGASTSESTPFLHPDLMGLPTMSVRHSCSTSGGYGDLRCFGRGGPWLGMGPNSADVAELSIGQNTVDGRNWQRLALGIEHTCGLAYELGYQGTQHLYCFGKNDQGQCGQPNGWQDLDVPTLVPLPPVEEAGGGEWTYVAAGPFHTCAATSSGHVYCFGQNVLGQAGREPGGNLDTPTLVAGITASPTNSPIAAGIGGTCVQNTLGTKCFGDKISMWALPVEAASWDLITGPIAPAVENYSLLVLRGGGSGLASMPMGCAAVGASRALWCWGDFVLSLGWRAPHPLPEP